MGCLATKNNKYKSPNNSQLYSHRDISAEIDPPIHHHSMGVLACGYGFNIDQKEIGKVLAVHLMAQRKQEEIDKLTEFEGLYQRLVDCYNQHNIDACAMITKNMVKLYETIDFKVLDDVDNQQKQEIFNFVKNVNQEHAEMLLFSKQLQKGGWVFKSQGKGMRISSRHEEDTVGILVQSQIDVPVQIFLSVIAQMQLYKEFVPFIEQSQQQKMLGRNHKIGNCVANFPFLSRRQAFFQGIGYNRLDHDNSVFMYSRSIHNKPQLCDKFDYHPKLNQKYVQIQFKYLIVKYQPIDAKRGKASLAINIDMKLNFIPLSILDYACQTFGTQFFVNLMKVSKKFTGSKWEQKIKSNPDSYNFFKSIVQNYFKNKQQKNIKN